MNELTAALKEELNVDTAFTLPIFGGIDIPESIAVSWGIMAFLVIGFDFCLHAISRSIISASARPSWKPLW